MSSPRLNSVAKRTQRQVMRARQQAFDQLFGQARACQMCGQEFMLGADAYRGVGLRDRVHVDVVRFACPSCGGDNPVPVDPQPAAHS